jgi:Hint domain-containing protein
VNCFSLDSFVKLSNGEYKRIDSIEIGDQILTIDNKKLVSTEVIMILDKHESRKGF